MLKYAPTFLTDLVVHACIAISHGPILPSPHKSSLRPRPLALHLLVVTMDWVIVGLSLIKLIFVEVLWHDGREDGACHNRCQCSPKSTCTGTSATYMLLHWQCWVGYNSYVIRA